MSEYLTLAQIKQLRTGDRVRVTWSGGNGSHEYTILRCADLTIFCTLPSDIAGRPHIVGTIHDPILDKWAQVSLHKVELIELG
jgi:hypothetical protein